MVRSNFLYFIDYLYLRDIYFKEIYEHNIMYEFAVGNFLI